MSITMERILNKIEKFNAEADTQKRKIEIFNFVKNVYDKFMNIRRLCITL